MPTGTRITTPIPRAYLSDPRLAAVRSALAREVFLRAKLVCDNLGRMPGEPGMVAGLLYPSAPPSSAKMQAALRELEASGLIFWFRVGQARYIEVADTGATQRIVGNMCVVSDYPPAPEKLIREWERKTGRKWVSVCESQSRSDCVRTQSKRRSSKVSTRSNGVSLSQVESGQVESGREELSRVEPDAAASASAAARVAPAGENHKPDYDKTLTFSGHVGFEPGKLPSNYAGANADLIAKGIGYEVGGDSEAFDTWDEFAPVVVEVFAEMSYEPWSGPETAERFMSRVLNVAKQNRCRYPAGWLKVLNDHRRELKLAAGDGRIQ